MEVKARSLLCLLAAGLILAWPGGASTPQTSALLTNIEVRLPQCYYRANPAAGEVVILELAPDPKEEVTLKIGKSIAKTYWVENKLNPRQWKLVVCKNRLDGQKVVTFVKKRNLFKRHFGPYLLDEESFSLVAQYFDVSHQWHGRRF